MKGKKGKLTTGTITSVVVMLVLIVVGFSIYASLVPEVQSSGDELGDSAMCADAGGYWNTTLESCRNNVSSGTVSTEYDYTPVPLGGLFSGTGFVAILIMLAFLVVVITSVMPKKK